ncbi:MAG: hypothetical protein ABI321_25030 [Polyangia bacterium]
MIGRLGGAVTLVVGLAAAATFAWVRMPLSTPLAAPTQSLPYVRASLAHASLPTLDDESTDQRGLPVIVSLFDHGAPVARGIGHGATFGEALRAAAEGLRGVDAALLARGRLKLDRVEGEGALSTTVAPLLALGVVPARDGVGAEAGGREVYFTVDDLLRRGAWDAYTLAPDLSLGMDPGRTLRMLEAALEHRPARAFRFRAEEVVEAVPGGTALSAECGRTPGPELTREHLLAAAEAGGRYLLSHLDDAGQFDYEYYTVEDERVGGQDYSLPRHAGAVSFLAALDAHTPDPAREAGMRRALDYLVRQRPHGCDGERICVGSPDAPVVDLGSSALSLVAAAEYERATSDARYEPFVQGLVAFVLSMQKPNGEFCHLFDAERRRRDEETQLLYYSGEAAYGLALTLAKHPDGRVEAALDRSLGYLTNTQYDHLAGQFYVGEDHWTCMAVDAGWEHLPAAHRVRYASFCAAFGRFMRKEQLRADEPLVRAQPQLAGAFGLSAAVTPHNTPVGSRTESMVSVWRIAKRLHVDGEVEVRDPKAQVLAAVDYLLAHQIRDEGAYLMTAPASAEGGFLVSDTERYIRIDVVQHAASAILRSVEML